jgi:hypothetical protein
MEEEWSTRQYYFLKNWGQTSTGYKLCCPGKSTLLDGSNVRLNWNIESDLNVYWIKFKNFLSLY